MSIFIILAIIEILAKSYFEKCKEVFQEKLVLNLLVNFNQ